MTANEVNAALRRLARTYVVDVFRLPNATYEQAASYVLRINDEGPGVLLVAGQHPNEMVTPAALLAFAERLCQAIRADTGLTFGKTTYTKDAITAVVGALNIVVFPLVNPDGADWQEQLTVPWRRNRALNWGAVCRPGYDCRGVDINRNFPFLWHCGFNASPDAWSSKYKGPAAASEAETQNLMWLLNQDEFAISYLLDLHALDRSDAGFVLHPWGDAPNQTKDPHQTFKSRPKCSVVSGPGYGEYISADDQAWFKNVSKAVAIAASSGGVTYTAKQSYELYPTTGTLCDYAYSRHIVDGNRRRVMPVLIEAASRFFPTPTRD
jgi:carboxypeptidase T